jgi:lipoprotein-releasing system permease protein
MKLELFVAARYLRAKRKQAVVSVITAVSVLGVSAGVGALVIALALNTGVQEELQSRILGATAHVSLLRSDGRPIRDYAPLAERLLSIGEVTRAGPIVYSPVFLVGSAQNQGIQLKGIDLSDRAAASEIFQRVLSGDIRSLTAPGDIPVIAIGSELSRKTGSGPGTTVRLLVAEGELSPLGRLPRARTFRVGAVYESGLWDLDANWGFVSLPTAQRLLSLADNEVTGLELRIRNIYRAEAVGREVEALAGDGYEALSWIALNRPLFSALQLEKLGMFVAIGLIVLVASLNIVTTLTLMVMEKHRDIAIITAMGGNRRSIMTVFMMQGIIIGIVGTLIGALVGIGASHFLDSRQLIRLAPDVYSISYVPFHTRWQDVALICCVALIVTWVAALYPARSAAGLDPVEALRYE